ncbi:MAG TPA: hypothetical protein PK440_21380 [Candidatus Accumulibacter phosphatis]|nr:hypothetical protein [Accumulibacter sp.]HCN68503.1 hypothetical protein [Accumulibacter sp.]HRL78565.1 hypothetical protein [Candidatus Accumulibacter phosphatis]HRQ97510.1 hypothetical protein [Candidatus Accumulibacter phosphatis]
MAKTLTSEGQVSIPKQICDASNRAPGDYRSRAGCLAARSDMVVLLAGLGAGTGNGVTPVMARSARDVGAVTTAAVVTPFDLEGATRNRRADAVTNRLQGEADWVIAFSNEEWINRFSGDTPLFDIFNALDRQIATTVHFVVARLSDPTNLTDSTFAPDCPSV